MPVNVTLTSLSFSPKLFNVRDEADFSEYSRFHVYNVNLPTSKCEVTQATR